MNACNFTPWLTVVAGVLIGVFAEPVRRWLFRPVLRASFEKESCVIKTPTVVHGQQKSEGVYVRIRVRNERGGRVARGCRAYLVNVETRESGEFAPTVFADSLRLKWSSHPPDEIAKPIDIPRGVAQFADVFSTDKVWPERFHLETAVVPLYCAHLFDNAPKTLRLTVLVTGDDVKPAMAHFVFDWKGAWNTFDTSTA